MSWDYPTKNAGSFDSYPIKNSDSWVDTEKVFYEQFLLLEDGGYLLLEDGGRIILEQSVPQPLTWDNAAKSA